MTSNYFRLYIAGYTVANFDVIQSDAVTKSSALEIAIHVVVDVLKFEHFSLCVKAV